MPRGERDDGTLELWAGNTAVHAMDVAFLERMSEHADALPWHLAKKKVPYLNQAGELGRADRTQCHQV